MGAVTIVRTIAELRAAVAAFRAQGDGVGLVPTMGALHDGHLALVARAKAEARRVVVTIFVNPAQFAPTEDLSKYPRTQEEDLRRLTEAKTDIVFMPAPEEIYPVGFATTVVVDGPATAGLEDRFRPEHFRGVATVVAKLFIQSAADIALFGEKDYQQLCVVRRMAGDLDIPIRIIGLETVRDADGLALSSRNRYLSAEERAVAPVIHRTLSACAAAIRQGGATRTVLAEGRETIERAGFVIDYLEARQVGTLAPITGAGGPTRLLVAARIGSTRLIDNLAV